MTDALGLRPPALQFEPALIWVLERAFGPAPQTCTKPEWAARAAQLALALDLSGRIVSRWGAQQIERELGTPAQALAQHHFLLCALDSLLQHTLRELDGALAAQGVRFVWLKYAALRCLGAVRPGARGAADLDLLVSRADEARCLGILRAYGYRPSRAPAYDHQLPAWIAPTGASVEVHRHLPGVRLAGRPGFACAEQLFESELWRTVPVANAVCRVPAPAVVMAHLAAHALLQSAPAPLSYPPLRILGDTLDLGSVEPRAGADSAAFLRGSLPEAWLEALLALCTALHAGHCPRADQPGAELLRHLLGARLNPDYALRLKLWAWTKPLYATKYPRWAAIRRALFPSREELAWIYSRQDGEAHPLLLYRLIRPLHIAGRAGRSLLAQLRAISSSPRQTE